MRLPGRATLELGPGSLGKVSSLDLQSLFEASKALVARQGWASGAINVESQAGVIAVFAVKVPLVHLGLGGLLEAKGYRTRECLAGGRAVIVVDGDGGFGGVTIVSAAGDGVSPVVPEDLDADSGLAEGGNGVGKSNEAKAGGEEGGEGDHFQVLRVLRPELDKRIVFDELRVTKNGRESERGGRYIYLSQ